MAESGEVAGKEEGREGGRKVVDKRVMVAIDESEYSYNALMWLLDNLKDSIVESPLVIFAAQQSTIYKYPFASSVSSAHLYYPFSAAPEFVNSVKEREKKVTLGILEKAKSICANRGVNAETVTEDGDPKAAICAAVEKLNIDLLILGDHGMGRIKRAFLGSVSSYCVLNAKCPVLVVKKSD